MKILLTTGTRPEIIKSAPIMWEMASAGIEYCWVHTGQHYDQNMAGSFFSKLMGDDPHVNLECGGLSFGEIMGRLPIKLDAVINDFKPDAVIAQGDTLSVMATATVAVRWGLPFVHVEAGLRSGDLTMPEEVSRIYCDHIAHLLLTPHVFASFELEQEKPQGKVECVGNTFVDSLKYAEGVMEKEGVPATPDDEYVLVTLHRPENVDDPVKSEKIVSLLERLPYRLVFPMHPRTEKQWAKFGLRLPDNVLTVGPMNYPGFLAHMKNAKFVITDSGGLQEETCYLMKPCVTFRKNTERPETLGKNNMLVDVMQASPVQLNQWIQRHLDEFSGMYKQPYGEGAGKKIVEILEREYAL